tara:strand:+ start:1261 stop:1845 length:585 start_codon:yes stop_codon:yes gene_type:complete
MHLSPADHSRGNNDKARASWRDDTGFSELYDYWESGREAGALPRADKFDLLALTPWLAEMCLLDVLGPENYFCRFAGTALVERLGFDMSQKNIFAFQSEATRDLTRAAYQAVINQPCCAIARYSNHYSSGRSGVVRTLYLPLGAPQGGNSRMACMSRREEEATYATPIEQSISGTDILDLIWIDIGFGVPDIKA